MKLATENITLLHDVSALIHLWRKSTSEIFVTHNHHYCKFKLSPVFSCLLPTDMFPCPLSLTVCASAARARWTDTGHTGYSGPTETCSVAI